METFSLFSILILDLLIKSNQSVIDIQFTLGTILGLHSLPDLHNVLSIMRAILTLWFSKYHCPPRPCTKYSSKCLGVFFSSMYGHLNDYRYFCGGRRIIIWCCSVTPKDLNMFLVNRFWIDSGPRASKGIKNFSLVQSSSPSCSSIFVFL